MPDWLVERGIGETRAALVDDGEIVEARIELDGTVPAGTVVEARLSDKGPNGRNATAITAGGVEFLLPLGPAQMPEGATITIEITREDIPGAERWKRPLARLADRPAAPAVSLAERLAARELVFPAPRDELAAAGWDDVIEEARTGLVGFAGGVLRISPTPAMTLIDVDGQLAPEDLTVVGASAAARAIRRLDLGGSVGIDLPTAGSKAARQASAQAIDDILPQPFERTAVNGFGFVQIVRPRRRASLVELAQDRALFEARALLRRAGRAAGSKRLVAHPALIGALNARSEWLDALARQVGGTIALRVDANLPISSGYAESL